jgi:hypothetical protein
MQFRRIRYLLAAFDRGEFSEVGLSARLDAYTERNERSPGPSRHQTSTGMAPITWCEP